MFEISIPVVLHVGAEGDFNGHIRHRRLLSNRGENAEIQRGPKSEMRFIKDAEKILGGDGLAIQKITDGPAAALRLGAVSKLTAQRIEFYFIDGRNRFHVARRFGVFLV